jgi:demethylmenaquinone methyltransferase/2-methoxy-6-polyprenyl-1,4-benzoquinol methylase
VSERSERTGPDRVLGEQREYYEQRAAEYDDWWLRRGRYDQGPAENARWNAESAEVRAALDRLDVRGDVLEVAPGTGQWSRLLLPRCDTLTLVDASPAMLHHNPAATDRRSRAVVADLFEWTTDERFDVVAFGFWLSHVPERLLGEFLGRVATWLRPGGRLFYVDSRPYASRVSPALVSTEGERHVRNLADGRQFEIVKVFRTSDELTAAFAAAGIDAEVFETASLFQYATGIRRF